MDTTTSRQDDPYAYQSQGDVNAILQGMTDATIDRQQARRDQALPAQVQPNYRAPLPVQLAQNAPQLPPEVQPNQPNYTVTGTGPGTWWRQQQQQQPPIPPQFQQNQQQQPVPLQPPPGLSYRPPQNSELPPVRNMPSLWNSNQVGASGQTKQQFLLGRMQHESQGDPTALNYVARGDPRMYDRGYTASGLLQDTNETWRNGVQWALADPERYPMHGDDPRKYPAAGYAPWHTQWQVNSAIYDHAGETPWREGAKSPGFQQRLGGGFYNAMAEPTQQYAPAQPRSFAEWGRTPTGMGGTRPGEMPRHTDFGRIMGAIAPLMVGLVSLAARMPLSTAITAYGAMARAQQNGQQLDYQRNRTRFQDQLKEHNAQQALESQEAGDAFSEYGNNNPQGLQQQLASIALKYNDPAMFRMAQNGDLNGIHQLQQRRDMGHQDLSKLHKAAEEEQLRQDRAADVAARDAQWDQEHPNATPQERAIAHARNQGLAERDIKGTGATGGEGVGATFNVVDKDGKPTGQQVIRSKSGGYIDPNTNEPVQLKPGERVEPLSAKPPKPASTNPYVVPGGKGEQSEPDSQQGEQQQGDQQQGDQQQGDQQQGDQQQGDQQDQQGTQDGGQDDQGDQQDRGSDQEGKASQAPPAPAQQAAAPAAGAPADQSGAPSTDPYQVAQAGSDVQPPPASQGKLEQGRETGPAMRNLTPGGQEIARQYLRGGDGALRMVEPKNRAPILDGAMEMQRKLDEIPDGLSGDAVRKAVRDIDPGLGRLLDMLLKNKQGEPASGRLGPTSTAFWTRMNELGVQADPGWSPQQYASLQQTRNSYGPQQRMGQTLLRSFRLAQLSKSLWDDAKDMPAGPVPANELQRWFESGVAGDPKYTKFASDWHNFAVESQAVINGGQPTVTLSRLLLDTLQRGATPTMIRQAIQADLTASLGAIDSAVTGWRQAFPDERNPGTYDQTGYGALYQLHTGNIATGELGAELPQIGTKEGGKTYLGGDPADQRNWR